MVEYQKSLVYNKHLPYAKLLDDEAAKLLEEIKLNLSVAIQKQELWPGALYWTNRLRSYMRVYGFQFSKEDHLRLVKLMYELVTIPNLESPLVQTWSNMLARLLRKWRLLSREDLILPWKPLYQLFRQVFYSKYKQLGMRNYSSYCLNSDRHASNSVLYLISQARCYFSVEATEEMLVEWRPLMCPFDLSMIEAMNMLSEFLPTLLPPDHHHRGFKLWFEEFVNLWLQPHAKTPAEEFFVKLIVRLAKYNVGYIDWTPYIPQIFTRILTSFHVPVGPKELQGGAHISYINAHKADILIVSMLGGGSPAQEHLDHFMVALESYYHPSNVGRHTKKLLSFLKDLTHQFIQRLKREHHSKPTWFHFTPEHAKLSATDIDAFVKCLLPALRMAMFSKFGTIEAAISFHNLSLVRPEMVLPNLLDSTYAALETLIEPHQLIATLQCVTSVCRALLKGGRYPEGRSHLFSLLTLALPGIDSNDFRKTLVSGLLISALVTLVPLIDCSPSIGHFDMTEQEVELCSLTSQFEDFVLQFLDRCFALVESTGLEQVAALDRTISSTSMENHESIMGLGIAGSVHSVLVQCSPKIFEVALDKLYRFATSHVFESEISGRMCADMCAAAAKVDAISSLKLFVPRCMDAINAILEDPDQHESEHPDNDLIWNIQLLSQVLHGLGDALLPYADALINCLKSCVHLKCKSAAKYAAQAICNALHCVTMTYPSESRSSALPFSVPPEEHLYIKDWAAAGDLHNLGLDWHVPSEKELHLVDRLLEEFLKTEMDRLQRFMEGETMDRDSLHQSLQLVVSGLLGSAPYLPMWEGKQVEGCPTSVVSLERSYFCTDEGIKLPPEHFRREQLSNFMHRLAEHIMEKCEDDTKSMHKMVQYKNRGRKPGRVSHVMLGTRLGILQLLLVNFGAEMGEFDGKWRAYAHSKVILDDNLRGKNRIRPMLISRIHLQHELRMQERSMSVLTPLHLTLIKDLFRMSVSTYAEVRIKAQQALMVCLDSYLYAGRKLLPDILPLLRNNGVSHEQFKGALHVMLLPPMISVYVHDWTLMKESYPIIVQADHSEKPSILVLMSRLLKEILTKYEYFTLQWQVPEGCVIVSTAIQSALSPQEVAEGTARTEEMNKNALCTYEQLVDCLVDLVKQEELQWRYSQMAVNLLVMLLRHDYPMPLSGVKLLVNCLIHDAVAIRKLSIGAVGVLLLQQKRPHKKIPVDVAINAGVKEVDTSQPPGERDDNRWLCYDRERVPTTAEQWNSFPFVDKTHWGYCAWPKTLYTYAPYSEQPQLDRKPEELSESERVLYDAFSSPEFVDKLVSFLSLEENKGRDHYDNSRFTLFKGLFRNFGTTFLALFKPHLEKLAVDSQESSQRCASEIIAGMVSGSKNWNYEMVEELREFLEPLLKKVIDVMIPETVDDWASCFTDISANRDPRRLHWILELMLANPLHGANGSFLDASHLYLLQSCLAQQEWRVASVNKRLIDFLSSHLTHPFKNVRERIGSLLAQIFLYDTSIGQVKFNPQRKEFLAVVSPHIPTVDELPTLDRTGDALRLCKTALVWMISSYQHAEPELFQLLAKLLPLIILEDDDEIVLLIKAACARMSHGELSLRNVPVALTCFDQAIDTGLWRVRVSTLQILQVMVFENLFMFSSHSEQITDLLLRLLEDTQIEVRELAASTISGLARCGYITNTDKLKALFIAHARTKLPQKNKLNTTGMTRDTGYEGLLVKRHSGVLGLAALVEACPYSIPEWLPEVLDEMALHLHDRAPIQATVKKTMSEFRRTHHDSWSEHKQKFTDDQLAVLADLLISPSYYA